MVLCSVFNSLTATDFTSAFVCFFTNISSITEPEGRLYIPLNKMDLLFSKAVIKAVQSTVNEPIVSFPSLGGSLPLYLFEKYLNASPITVPIANLDYNQHAENENIRIGNLLAGVETFVALMGMK